jgi:hypothetical protein
MLKVWGPVGVFFALAIGCIITAPKEVAPPSSKKPVSSVSTTTPMATDPQAALTTTQVSLANTRPR